MHGSSIEHFVACGHLSDGCFKANLSIVKEVEAGAFLALAGLLFSLLRQHLPMDAALKT